MKLFKSTLCIILSLTSLSALASKSLKVWGNIPFQRGPDLCGYKQAFSQTRQIYMSEMVGLANSLMQSGAYGDEAKEILEKFDELYDSHKNLAINDSEQYLSIELENSLKGSLDQLYRDISTENKRIVFYHSVKSNEEKVNYIGYGSYAFAPQCQGEIKVSVTLIDNQGLSQTFQATGRPETVMAPIAQEILREFQKTKFHSSVKTSAGDLELVPSSNGDIGKVRRLELARRQCQIRGARLPSAIELEDIAGYGDWNGGISLGHNVWVVDEPNIGLKIYAPFLAAPNLSPVRDPFAVNTREFHFFCVR